MKLQTTLNSYKLTLSCRSNVLSTHCKLCRTYYHIFTLANGSLCSVRLVLLVTRSPRESSMKTFLYASALGSPSFSIFKQISSAIPRLAWIYIASGFWHLLMVYKPKIVQAWLLPCLGMLIISSIATLRKVRRRDRTFCWRWVIVHKEFRQLDPRI